MQGVGLDEKQKKFVALRPKKRHYRLVVSEQYAMRQETPTTECFNSSLTDVQTG